MGPGQALWPWRLGSRTAPLPCPLLFQDLSRSSGLSRAPAPPSTPEDTELRPRLDRAGHLQLQARPGPASCCSIWPTP